MEACANVGSPAKVQSWAHASLRSKRSWAVHYCCWGGWRHSWGDPNKDTHAESAGWRWLAPQDSHVLTQWQWTQPPWISGPPCRGGGMHSLLHTKLSLGPPRSCWPPPPALNAPLPTLYFLTLDLQESFFLHKDFLHYPSSKCFLWSFILPTYYELLADQSQTTSLILHTIWGVLSILMNDSDSVCSMPC